MTQEEKQLLFQDLCTKLPYGVKIELMPITKGKCTILTPTILRDYIVYEDVNYLPYLRSMSSMTEEEMCKFERFGWRVDELDNNTPWVCNAYNMFDGIDWLNAHHFDYRGLIEKGLALEAPEGMYKA